VPNILSASGWTGEFGVLRAGYGLQRTGHWRRPWSRCLGGVSSLMRPCRCCRWRRCD